MTIRESLAPNADQMRTNEKKSKKNKQQAAMDQSNEHDGSQQSMIKYGYNYKDQKEEMSRVEEGPKLSNQKKSI